MGKHTETENNISNALIVQEALKNFAKNPEGIENFCSYLSYHFAEWLNKYANTPEGLASELLNFSKIGYNEVKEG